MYKFHRRFTDTNFSVKGLNNKNIKLFVLYLYAGQNRKWFDHPQTPNSSEVMGMLRTEGRK